MDFYHKFFSKPDENTKRKELSTAFRQSINTLENDFLEFGIISDSAEPVQSFIKTFLDVLQDGLDPSKLHDKDIKIHLWTILSTCIDLESVAYVNAWEKSGSWAEKLSLWVLVEFDNKSLASSFEKLAKEQKILQYYTDAAIIRRSPWEIKEGLEKLMHPKNSIESEILTAYYRSQVEQRSNTTSEGDSSNKSLNDSQSMSGSAPKSVEEIKGNLDRFKKLLEKSQSSKVQEERQTFIRDDYKQYLQEKQQRKPLNIIRKILGPAGFSQSRKSRSRSKSKVHRRTSSFDDSEAKKVDIEAHKYNSDDEEDKKNCGHKQNMSLSAMVRSEDDNAISSITEETNQSFRSDPKVVFTADDYAMFDEKTVERKQSRRSIAYRPYQRVEENRFLKRSDVLYTQKYKIIQQEYEYRNPPTKIMKAEDQDYKCFGCQTPLNKLLLAVWSKNSFCHYTGYWYCSNCMSEEKLYIPWYIQENFDFKRYHVCKKASVELHNFYDKPNVVIDSKSPIAQKNKLLYETLVMKRQLHLIFDMICEGLHVLDLLGQNSNLLLKVNLFSVKHLVEINTGAMLHYIEKCHRIIISHIDSCKLCQQKGKICPSCKDPKRIFAYDIKNTSICRICKSLYHTKCLYRRNCIVCQHDY